MPSIAIAACLVRRRHHRETGRRNRDVALTSVRQTALFWRRNRLARTRITLSAKNGVFLTKKRN